jgi:uncharacterized protein YaaQ
MYYNKFTVVSRGVWPDLPRFVSSHDQNHGESTIQKAKFSTLVFLTAGGFGGNMGLLLGCSILTLCEFVDVIVLVIIEWCRKKQCNVQPISVTGERRSSLFKKSNKLNGQVNNTII